MSNQVASALWTLVVAVASVVALTIIIEWRRPEVADVRAIVRSELRVRDSLADVRAESLMARTDSIVALIEQPQRLATGGPQDWVQLAHAIRAEHALILRNQSDIKTRVGDMHSDLLNAICYWTANRAQPCR